MKRVKTDLQATKCFFEVLEKKRAIRKFKPFDISDHYLKKIFEAARLAPSARARARKLRGEVKR